MVKVIDNITSILSDDLAKTIHKGDKVSIAAAYFSMYAYAQAEDRFGRRNLCD